MQLTGASGAPGYALGPVWVPPVLAPPTYAGERAWAPPAIVEPDAVAAQAADQLRAIADRLRIDDRSDEAGIFEAQAMIATDPSLIGDWRQRISAGEDPIAALRAVTEAAADILAGLPDEFLSARAADVRDVGERLERAALGLDVELPQEPSVVVARDLPPSMAAEIPPGLLLGVALEAGSRTAHAAILARGLGIPCVVGVAGLLDAVAASRASSAALLQVAVDGAAGVVLLAPGPAELEAFEHRRGEAGTRAQFVQTFRERPGRTLDGHRVALLANIGGPADVARALDARAEGVGLFRTEFLFMGRRRPPTEHEQIQAYLQVFAAFGRDRPVVVRLADIGGDKDVPYLRLPHEENPFLGMRALRIAYRDRGLYLTQIRAVSQAAAAANVEPHVMAPMVATIEDVELLHELVRVAQTQLAAEGLPAAPRIVTGIMVEVPSAALLAPELARAVDFFSLGTNDLTQYLLAADRTNQELALFQDGLHPAVLRAIRMVTSAAAAAGKPVAVCGELAGDGPAALVLVGLGVDELSADAGSLDALRYELAQVNFADLRRLAERALGARNATEVREMAAEVERSAPAEVEG